MERKRKSKKDNTKLDDLERALSKCISLINIIFIISFVMKRVIKIDSNLILNTTFRGKLK